jgi:hypothetical protein
MTFRLFPPTKEPKSYKGIRARSSVLPSAEAAWPFRGPGRTAQENIEAIERMERYLREADARAQTD